MSDAPGHPPGHRGFLERFFENEILAWRGEAAWSRVFWFQGVLTSVVLIVLYATTIYLHQAIAEQIMLILVACYTVWILVSIWRCSLASYTYWAMLARHLTIFWALNTGLLLVFRQLDLLVLFAGRVGPAPF